MRIKAIDGRAALERLKGKRRYDVEMIREFVEQLILEVRIHHQEHTTRMGGMSFELREELRRFTGRHGATLLPMSVLDESGIHHEDLTRANQLMQQRLGDMYGDWLDQLESLFKLFTLALQCTEISAEHGRTPRRTVQAAELIAQDDARRAKAIERGEDPDDPKSGL